MPVGSAPEATSEAEIEAMLTVDLLAPILPTRAAIPSLRASGRAMVVNVTSGIALVGAPFYATYAAAKAGLARFGEALLRELKGEGIHVLTVYPGGTDTPMMKTNWAGPDLGFGRASAGAEATIEGIEADAFDVIRGGETRAQMIALNRDNPAAIDERMLRMKAALIWSHIPGSFHGSVSGKFDNVASRPGTHRAYAKGEPFSALPAVTEEGKKLLFGQTASSAVAH